MKGGIYKDPSVWRGRSISRGRLYYVEWQMARVLVNDDIPRSLESVAQQPRHAQTAGTGMILYIEAQQIIHTCAIKNIWFNIVIFLIGRRPSLYTMYPLDSFAGIKSIKCTQQNLIFQCY